MKQEGDADTPPRREPGEAGEPRLEELPGDTPPTSEWRVPEGRSAEPAPAAPAPAPAPAERAGIAGRFKRLLGAEGEGTNAPSGAPTEAPAAAPSRTAPRTAEAPAPASGAGVGQEAVASVLLADLRGRLERLEASVEAELASLRAAHEVARAERHDELLKLLDLVSQQLGAASSENEELRVEIAETRERASRLEAQVLELRNTVFGVEEMPE